MNTLSHEDILKISKKKKRSIKAKKDIIGFDVMGGAESFPITKESMEILEMVDTTWSAGAPFRRQTQRSDRYYKGDQWKDKVEIRHRDGTKEVLTEAMVLHLEVRIIVVLLIIVEVVVLHHRVVVILAEAVVVHAHPIAVAVVDHIHPVAAVEAVAVVAVEDKIMNNKKLKL